MKSEQNTIKAELIINLLKKDGNYYYECKPLGVYSERLLTKRFDMAKNLAIKKTKALITKSSRFYDTTLKLKSSL